MTKSEIIVWAVGLGLPVIAAPLIVFALRYLFAVFLAEGAELFAKIQLARNDSMVLGSMMAKLNVAVLLATWLSLFTCIRFDQPIWICTGIALAGMFIAILLTLAIVRSNLDVAGRTLAIVSLMAFAGGNLPIIVIIGALLVFAR